MSYTVSLQRNPNLSIPQSFSEKSNNEVQTQFGNHWWTGLPPQECPGYLPEKGYLQALPLINLDTCTRQDILDYFDNIWTLTEILFSSLKQESTFQRPPYHELRHPLIFYYGHPAVLYYNKLRLAGLFSKPIDLYLEKILETGVDEMSWDDMSKNQMQWPSVKEVQAYRKKVYCEVRDLIKNHPDLENAPQRNLKSTSPFWSLFMGFEHEKIHLETTSVLMRELPLELVEQPRFWPPQHPSALTKKPTQPVINTDFPMNHWKTITGRKVTYGKPPSAPSFGWDNEYGTRTKDLADFQVTENLITNGEFYEFVATQSYTKDSYWSQEGLQWRKFRNSKRPTFWIAHGPEGLHDYKLRTIFDAIDMPWDWPVEVNFHEAQAFCQWKQEKDHSKLVYRLITEPEHVLLREPTNEDVVLQKKSYSQNKFAEYKFDYNFNLTYSSASPVTFYPPNSQGVRDLFGNTWQWAEDQFNPLDGFSAHSLYDDFSTPCFDGKHQMILGGSFISCGHEASKWARFHFRPHFFQHAGFRMAATLDGSADNGSTKIIQTNEYLHPRRQNILDQMNETHWWKNIQQPLDLSATELSDFWNSTLQNILKFESERASLSPMGEALDPKTSDVAADFRLAYQGIKNFPQRPEDFGKLLDIIFKELTPTGQLPGHPGYMAYVAGAGNAISNMAQAIAGTINQYTAHYSLAPGLVTLELEALKWLTNMVQYPEDRSGGFFTTGGSLATLSALSLAKKNKMKGYDLATARFYASENSHHCVGKSLAVLGFPPESLTLIAINEKFQMDAVKLSAAIEKDVQLGFQPIAIIATAGATTTGSIDDLLEMTAIAEKYKLWLHIDGAYGAFFCLTSQGQQALKGMEFSDSIALDPHKSFSLPYGTGCLLVKDRKNLSYDYVGKKTYMPPSPELLAQGPEKVDFADITPELSRDFRGLRFWLPLKTLGVGPFQLNLEEKLNLATFLADELSLIPGIEVLTKPQLTVVNFKLKTNEKTQGLLTKINQSQKFYLSACTLNNHFVIRVCLLGFRSHFAEVQNLIKLIKSELKSLGE